VIGQASFHRRRNAQRLMDTAEIVVRGWPTFAVSAKVGTYAARIAILILSLSD